MEKISIIIPIYNAEDYLRDCLDSLTRQTYENWEAVLVNDGSKDGSEDICKEYCQKDSRFVLISGPNHGAAGARNIGLDHASGDYIAYLDSDDWYEDDYLEYLLKVLHDHDADISVCDFMTNGQPEYKWADEQMDGKQAMIALLNGGYCSRTPNKLYKREIIGDIRFPEGRNLCEDAVWTANVLERVRRVARGSEAKYNIRLTEGSITRKRMKTEKELCAFYRNLLDRCVVFLRNYPSMKKDRRLIMKECDRCFRLALESGCDLNIWDVYGTARALVSANVETFERDGSRLYRFFLDGRNARQCSSKYFFAMLLSRKVPFADKKNLLYVRTVSIARKVLKHG